MWIHKLIADNFNSQSAVGKIAWAIIFAVLGYMWRRFKATPNAVKREFGLGVTGVVAIILLLTLTSQISSRYSPKESDGFKASIILAAPVPPGIVKTVTDATNASAATFSSENAGSTKAAGGINMLFIVRVVNPGAPSVAWNWKASVTMPGGTTLDATIPSISGMNGTIPTLVGPYNANMENNLLQRLSTRRLETGDGTIGWFLVHVNGLDSPPEGAHFVISFSDVFGHETKVDDHWIPGH
jgi:hypothetical protein